MALAYNLFIKGTYINDTLSYIVQFSFFARWFYLNHFYRNKRRMFATITSKFKLRSNGLNETDRLTTIHILVAQLVMKLSSNGLNETDWLIFKS